MNKRNPQSPFNQFEFGVDTLFCCYTGGPSNYISSFTRHDQNLNDKVLESPNDTLTRGWHHVIYCNEINGRASLYVDNKLVDSSVVSSGTVQVVGYPLYVGGQVSLDGAYYTGKIDDIRIYNRKLSLPEIDTLYGEDLSTGVDEQLFQQVNLYPNPSSGHFTLESPEAVIESIELYDLTGRSINAEIVMDRHEAEIKTDYRGLVIVQIRTPKGKRFRKILLE